MSRLMKRSLAAQLGRETVRILEAGRYQAPSGTVVDIGDLVQRCVAGTCSYSPEYNTTPSHPGDRQTQVAVVNESTLVAAWKLLNAGLRPVALNFASAKHPGGGFLSGARAQEESLARSSGLSACLFGNAMYAFHQAQLDPMYSNYAIYSPDVPVFRDDDGTLLEQPWPCAFITSPAVNAKVVLERDHQRRQDIRAAMWERVQKVLGLATAHGHEALVLGAWGCGVFGNDSEDVAQLFHRALAEGFRGAFTHVVFAVLDWSEERRFIGPFERTFAAREA